MISRFFNKETVYITEEQIIVCKSKYKDYFKRKYENIKIIDKDRVDLACTKTNYSFDGHKKPLLSDKKKEYIYQRVSDKKYITQIGERNKLNLKFIIFLPEKEISSRNWYGVQLDTRLTNKGIHAITYDNWKIFFDKYNGIIPKFDLNETEPSPYIVYKRFTDSLYFNMDSYNQLSFKHEIKILSTLASYLGAKSITGHEKHSVSSSIQIDVDAKLSTAPVSGGVGGENNTSNENYIVEQKEFDATVDEEFFRGKDLFDKRAKSDLLMSIDSEIYERLQLSDVVAQRFNGQTIESYTLYKAENIQEKIHINTVFSSICPQFNINFNIQHSEKKLEEYEFNIIYYPIQDLIKNTKYTTIQRQLSFSSIDKDYNSDEESQNSKHSEETLSSNSSTSSKRKSLEIMNTIKNMGDDVNTKFMKWIRTQDVEKFKDQCSSFMDKDDVKTFLKNKNIL